MKKIVSIAIAFLVVVSLAPMLPVSADWDGLNSTVLGFSSLDMLDDREVHDFGKIVLGKDTQILRIFVKHNNFDFGTMNGGTAAQKGAQISQELMDSIRLEFRYKGSENNAWPGRGDWSRDPDPKFFQAKYNGIPISGSAKEAVYTLTPEGIGEVSMDVRLVFVDPDDKSQVLETSDEIHVEGVYLDPTINKHIVEIAEYSLKDAPTVLGNPKAIRLNDSAITSESLLSLNIQPGDVIRIDIDTSYFNWNPDIFGMNSSVRKSTLDNDKISVMKKVINGNSIIKSIGFENVGGAAEVVIRFADTFDKVEDRDFNFEIALAQDNKRKESSSATLRGTFGNDIYEVTQDKDYVFIGDGTIAHALNFVKDVELDLGEGMVVTMNLLDDQKYYGRATTEVDSDARAIMNYFPVIRKTITSSTHNISTRARFVEFREQETNYFVYDRDGQYLGRSAEKIVFRDRYFLSTKEIDFTADLVDELVAPFEEVEIEIIGENPVTGSGNLGLGVLNVVGLAVLAVGVFALSKKDDKED